MTDSPNTEAADAYGDAWAAVYDDEHRFLVPGEDQLGVLEDLCRFQDGQSLRTVRAASDDVRIDASVHDPVNQRVGSNIVRLASEGISVRPVRLRYAWPAELDLMAQLAGLRLHHRWSDWQRRPFVAESKSHITIYELPR